MAVDLPGFIYFPGTVGNYISVPDAAALDITPDICIVAKIAPDDWSPASAGVIAAKNNPVNGQKSWVFQVGTSGALTFSYSVDGSAMPGLNSSVPAFTDGSAQWVGVAFDHDGGPAGVAQARFWKSTDGTTWTSISDANGGAAAASLFNSTVPVTIGAHNAGLSENFRGKIYHVSIRSGTGAAGAIGGTEVLRFDASTDLAGVVPDATSFALSAPVGTVATINQAKKALTQGYVRFPGTSGNYLQSPDAPNLDITGPLTVIVRIRTDSTPSTFSIPVARGLSYRMVIGPYGAQWSWSTDGTTPANTAGVVLGAIGPDTQGWVWYSFYFAPANRNVKLWYSLTDTLTPPPDASWTSIHTSTSSATTIYAGSDPLQVGQLVEGDIGYVAIRTNGSNTSPLGTGGTDVFVLTPDDLIGVEPTAPTLTAATTGQSVTVFRSPLPKRSGFIQFPGTVGNDLVVPDVPALRIAGSTSFVFAIEPATWRPFEAQTIFSKWGDPPLRSYAIMLNTDGFLQFLYSGNGTSYETLTCDVPVPEGSGLLFVRVDVFNTSSWAAEFFTSLDGIDWTMLGNTKQGVAFGMFGAAAPLVIGAKFAGRMLSAVIYGSYSYITELFRLASEHIPTNPFASTLALPTGDATVRRDIVPVDYGYIVLPGTVGNYLSVPNHASLNNVTGFVAEARLVADDWTPAEQDRWIMGKTNIGSSNLSWRFLLTTRGTLAFQWSTNGTTYANYVESAPLGYTPQSAKRVAVSYEAGQYVRFWTSDDNRTWTRISQTAVSGSMVASTSPLIVGYMFKGAISHFSYRVSFGPGGVPIQGNEVLLVDQTSLDIPVVSTSFPAVTGQTVSIVKNTTAANTADNTGWLYFPGTYGNYTTTTAAGPPVFPAVPGSMTFDLRIAPDRWRGQPVRADPNDPDSAISSYVGPVQTICGRWSAGNNHSWLLRLSPAGEFLFTWTSSDGATEYTATSRPVPSTTNGEFRYLKLTVDMAPSLQTLTLYESFDMGDTFPLIGTAVTTTNPTTGLVQGNGPFWMGATETTGGADHFGGRLSHLVIKGTDDAEIFRLDQEALRVPTANITLQEGKGKTVTLAQSATPTISGYASFDGVTGEYCRVASVPNLSTVTSDFSIKVRVNFTTPLVDTEQVIVQKWSVLESVEVTNVALTSNVATITTEEAHGLKTGDKVMITEVGAPFDGTVTVVAAPTTTTFTFAKTNANIASVEAGGDVTPMGRSFSLRREGDEFVFLASMDGVVDDINAVLADVWNDDLTDWGWLAVTVNYAATGAVVTFWTAPDLLTPVGTPLVPLEGDWVMQGDPLSFEDITALYMDTEQLTFGGHEDGTSPLRGWLSNVSITNGVGTSNRPGGTEKFGWNINSFAGIAADSGAFTAYTGENVVLMPVAGRTKLAVVPSAPGPTTDIVPSQPGLATAILPSPAGPTTALVHGEDGPVTTLVASSSGPPLAIMPPSLDRPWYPGTEDEDTSRWWRQPAFTVQRTIDVTAGDYVRGSTSTRTQQTALRYPTTLPGWTPAGVGKGTLFSAPINYDTIEIEWNIPPQLAISVDDTHTVADIKWSEVVIIRCGMGYPATVNDGQAVMRMTKRQLYPNGYRYDIATNEIVTPNQYDPRTLPSQDPGLTPGRWYYYGLFFKIGRDWVRSAVHSCLLPRNYHHSEHLWNGLPPYYRYLDDNQRGGANDGDLKRWLSIFGYHLDYTREYVESMANMYHTDFTPMSLLRRIGDNFGVPFEPAIGDYCYRALVGQIGHLYRGRGTVGGLMSLVSAAAKCDSDVTQSDNMLLLPDDSEFINGTGDWAGIHDMTIGPAPYLPPNGVGIPGTGWLSYDKLYFSNGTYGYLPSPVSGKGMMHVYTLPADSTTDLFITCGDGRVYGDPPESQPYEIFPVDRGTPVKPDDIYGFSISVATEFTGPVFWAHLLWFKAGGQPTDYIGHSPGTVSRSPTQAPHANEWLVASVTGTAPAGAAYVVPAIMITGRVSAASKTLTTRSPFVHFSGAQLYYVGSAKTYTSDVFVKTLTLTDPTKPPNTPVEPIGAADGSHPDPFFIGEKSS